MNENREHPAASIKRQVDELAELISPDLVDALSEAAEDDDVWLEAARDTRAFLHEKGVALPDWAEIRLEAVIPATTVRSQKDLPQCDEGEVLVAKPGRPYCARPVYVCRRAPHGEEVCIFRFCMKWERDWLDAHCVPTTDLQWVAQVFSLPTPYGGP